MTDPTRTEPTGFDGNQPQPPDLWARTATETEAKKAVSSTPGWERELLEKLVLGTLAEQRATWFTQAIEVLGSRDAIRQMIDKALHPLRPHAVQQADEQWVRRTAGKVLAHVQAHRSSWQTWHLRAEAHRHIRDLAVPAARVAQAYKKSVLGVQTGQIFRVNG